MTFRRSLIAILIFLSAIFRLSAQEKGSQVDSLVRLLSAQSMELIEKDGIDYRKVTGPARFLHNDTYLICDTALWNMRNNEIYAISNVKILQDQTVLTGDRLTYYIDRDLAEFRGSLVQLEDKDHNVLRTEFLDYNTKDSVAIFFNGGSMKDKDGQVIESRTGTYDSKIKTFTFTENVNMFTDSVFVKSTSIVYDSRRNVATFGYSTDAWSEDNMLSSNAGWYDRNREVFLFRNNVHGMSDTQEGWADSLFYYRPTRDIELLGNAQVTDTTRDVSALAGRMFYTDSLSEIVMSRKPAVVGVMKEDNAAPDTVYFGADTLIARAIMKFQVNENELKDSKSRMDNLAVDAVQTYRQKAAKEAAEAAAKAAENDPNRPRPNKRQDNADARGAEQTPPPAAPSPDVEVEPEPEPEQNFHSPVDSLGAPAADSLTVPVDSLGAVALSDSTLVQSADSVAAPVDSTKLNFITAIRNVRLFKSDMQIACDSLVYNDIDSLVRMYRKPYVWNEVNRQYSADSIYAVIKNRAMQKASLMSNAFIIVKEDTLCFDQIRATEMLAYFDSTGGLRRFDALGDASAVFYLQEDSVYATVNKSEAKMLYAEFKEGDLDRVYYFESAKNDAYPVAQMTNEERVLKGFDWQPSLRPRGPEDVTPLSLRPSQREQYASRPNATFDYTARYYPGYMDGVMKKIEKGKIAKANAGHNKPRKPETDTVTVEKPAVADTLASIPVPSDTLAVTDSLSVPEQTVTADSLKVNADTTAAVKDERTLKAEQRAAAKAAAIAAREAKWARLDSLDAAKAQAKADKKAAKLRAQKLKQLKALKAQADKEKARLEKYKAIYQKQKEREDKKAAAKSSRAARKNGGKIPDEIQKDSKAVAAEPSPALTAEIPESEQ